ncbi:UDP-D-xylose:L-fucose alpha-1,3-D-xylosyltransferase MGP4 [Lycium ferocissimum]|uniref:UDP-D-xylose:L-fucose alpha-1,3-D-xylosyltransferase MGP4 n=1 Tax=Lycium ferocissimum TaxID=112874 RepID=UPI0028166C79|nr:UDP-D-xylose:L-fucose alpha-1,3-D-xylosyltransferase MGP4 [Lycium ferocissimum]
MSSTSLHQRPLHNPLTDSNPLSPPSSQTSQKHTSFLQSRTTLLFLLSLLVILGVLYPYIQFPQNGFLSYTSKSNLFESKWRDYSLPKAAAFVAKNNTLIVCIVSEPYLPFLNNWLISIVRQKHHEKVLVIAEDYPTLFKVNERWPGHAVIIPPVLESQTAHKFGSQGFFNFTSRRPRHLLQILELGYNVMYNDVDMVWLADPFQYLEGKHDIYFMDDMAAVKHLNHSHGLPPPGKKGRPYICSCMIYARPTNGAKLVMKKWIEEMQIQPWSRAKKANDQPAFNWALMKTAEQVDMYLLPQSGFPTGGLYFRNKTWVKETKGMHVIIHNNYIVGFEKKTKRFRDYGLWLVDDYSSESPLGRLD